jgi:hypothetical protein
MRPRTLGAGLVLALLLALPLLADDKKTPVDSEKLTPGDFTGKLKSTPGSDRSFTLTVEYSHLELKNPNQLPKNNPALKNLTKDVQKVARLQQQVANAKKPQDQVKRLQELQNAVAQLQLQAARADVNIQQLFKTVTNKKDIDFRAAEEVKVRTLNPPVTFDEKGNVKKYTREELKELKGKDSNLPGYESSFDQLQAGQVLKVTLARTKEPAKSDKDKDADKDNDNDKDKDKDNDKDKDKSADKKSEVTLILIKSDGTTSSDTSKPAKP